MIMETKDILDRIYESKKAKMSIRPQYVTRASEVGHPCERYLVYSITNWQDRKPYDVGLQFIFDGGNIMEDMAVKYLIDAGFKVYRPEPDKAIMESRPQISGHIDIRVDFGDGTVYTGEIKGLSEYDWSDLNTIEDFYNSKKYYIRKYPAQLMTYMYIKGEEKGFFFLINKKTYLPKLIWVTLDLDYMESILQKTERIEQHIKNKTLPDRIPDIDICENCQFAHICLPDMIRKEIDFVDNTDMAGMLDRREQLKEYVSEYNELDSDLKKAFNNREKLVCGNWLITGQKIEKKSFVMPESSYVKYKIIKL